MKPRLRRLLGGDGRCLDVAIDHGFFGEPALLSGIEDIAATLRALVEAAPDAIQLSLGQAQFLQGSLPSASPSLVLRVDTANVYGSQHPNYLYSQLIDEAVERAVRLDASCMCVNLLSIPGHAELTHACVRNICALQARADALGMPLMVEPLAMKGTDGPYAVNGDVKTIVALVRLAVELGADLIKADPTDNLDDYGAVIEAAGGRPLLVRGGARVSDEEMLARAHLVLSQGASGIVYGRNIVQHERPGQVTRALMSLLHRGADVQAALEEINAGQ